MQLEVVRAFALSLPEATEAPHFDMASYRVRGKIFATVPPDGEYLHVFVEEHAARAVVAENPVAFEELWWGKQLRGVRVSLPKADEELVRELLEESWRMRAPKQVVAAFDAAGARPA